jgi:hypothetical protein
MVAKQDDVVKNTIVEWFSRLQLKVCLAGPADSSEQVAP